MDTLAVVAAFVATKAVSPLPSVLAVPHQAQAMARRPRRLRHPCPLNRRHIDVVELVRLRLYTAIRLDIMPFTSTPHTATPTFADPTSATGLGQGGTKGPCLGLPVSAPALAVPDNTDQLLPRNVDLVTDILRDTGPRAPNTFPRLRLRLLFDNDHIRQIAPRSPRHCSVALRLSVLFVKYFAVWP